MQATHNTTYDGACDCHVHIYEDKYPLIPNVTVIPPHSPVSAYREVQRALGLSRAVIVQPTGYGWDNSCTLDALTQLGDAARGIALVAPDAPDAEFQRLHDGGMRGVRFMMLLFMLPLVMWPSSLHAVGAGMSRGSRRQGVSAADDDSFPLAGSAPSDRRNDADS